VYYRYGDETPPIKIKTDDHKVMQDSLAENGECALYKGHSYYMRVMKTDENPGLLLHLGYVGKQNKLRKNL